MQTAKETIYGWPGFRLSAGDLRVGVIPAPGARIISLAYGGTELLYHDARLAGDAPSLPADRSAAQLKAELGFRLWGGDKTWLAPQAAWGGGLPPIDLDGGAYVWREIESGLELESPLCRETGLKIRRRITLDESATLTLREELYNPGPEPSARGVWNVTQFLRPMEVYAPIPRAELRAYDNEGDSHAARERCAHVEDAAWTRIDCTAPLHFKFGGIAQRGEIYALYQGEDAPIAYQRTFRAEPSATYLHGSSFEIYNSPDCNYLEIELHAPACVLQPGASQVLEQTWRFSAAGAARTLAELRGLFA